MVIHLVEEAIRAKRAHQRAQSGEFIPLVRGLYVENDRDAEAAIPGHAVRIAHYRDWGINVFMLWAAVVQSCYIQGLLYGAALGRAAQALGRRATNVLLAHSLGSTNSHSRELENDRNHGHGGSP